MDDDGTAGSSGDGGAPPQEEAIYSAEYLPTGALRFAVYKTVPARDVCVIIVVGQLGGEGPFDVDVEPDNWLVESIHVLRGITECGPGSTLAWPPGEHAVIASAAEGEISMRPADFPCHVELDLNAHFPLGQPWAEPNERFEGGVQLEGGCD